LYFYEYNVENSNEILVNSISNSDIKVFSNYICDDDELKNLLKNMEYTRYFPIDVNTKSYDLEM
jgi:hypothetical protein